MNIFNRWIEIENNYNWYKLNIKNINSIENLFSLQMLKYFKFVIKLYEKITATKFIDVYLFFLFTNNLNNFYS